MPDNEDNGINWEKEVDRQGLSGGLRKGNDTMVVLAKLLGNYKDYLLKNGFSEDEAFKLVRDYSDVFLMTIFREG